MINIRHSRIVVSDAENGWLSKDEVGFAVKVYRMMKQDIDFDHFTSVYENISKGVGGSV